jgi:long-chain fatty acid transport protein
MKIRKIAALTALALLPGISFATVGYFAHGYGMKSIGMGGVGIALPQDALAAAANPAGMVLVGDRYDVGLTLFRPDREASISGSGAPVNGTYDANGKSNFFVPEFGYNKMMNPDLSLGVSVYGNGGMNTTYDGGIPLFGTGRAGVDLSQLFVAPTLSAKLDRTHSIGLSLNLAYQRFKAEGLQNFTAPVGDPAQFSESPDSLTNTGYDTSTGWGIRLGWTGQVVTGLTLGATWQSKTNMSRFDKYKGLFAEQGDFDIPENFGFGAAFQATPALTIAADVMRIKYSGVPAIANSGANQTLFGSDNGPGFGWEDMTVYKIGANYVVHPGLTLRGGFATGSQPIPSSDTLFNILAPGVVENHLTLGATWTMADKSEMTVGYMHAFGKTVNGSNSIPPAFGGGEANLKMQQNSIGIAYGRKL